MEHRISEIFQDSPCLNGSDLRRQALSDPADLHDDEEVDVHLQPGERTKHATEHNALHY